MTYLMFDYAVPATLLTVLAMAVAGGVAAAVDRLLSRRRRS